MLNIPALLLNKNELRWSKLPADDLLEIKCNRVPDWTGKMIISLSMNITMNQLGGASVIAKFHS